MTHFKKEKKTLLERIVATARRLRFLLETRVLRVPQLRHRASFSVAPDPSRRLAWEQSLPALGAAKPHLHFITFGEGKNFPPEVLADDVRRLGFYDTVQALDVRDLDAEFRAKHWRWMRRNQRGFGYWIWKPYLIARALRALNEGDILFYADAGCIAYDDEDQRARREQAVAELQKPSCFLMMSPPGHTLQRHCKRDVMEALGGAAFGGKKIYEGTRLGLRKCAATSALIGEWSDLVGAQRYALFDDTPSGARNSADFEAHRHDQSVLSVLLHAKGYEKNLWQKQIPFFAARFNRRRLHAILEKGEFQFNFATGWDKLALDATRRWLDWRNRDGRLGLRAQSLLARLRKEAV